MKTSIYIITNILNAKQYIGISNNLKRRWSDHSKAECDTYFHRAIRKHGLNNFIFTHFADAFDSDSAKQIEIMLIKEHNTFYPNGYNGTLGGDGTFGRKHLPEEIAKIKETNKKTYENLYVNTENVSKS